MTRALNVTLTATTNPALIDRCPLLGQLTAYEQAPDGTITHAGFRELDHTGTLQPMVSCPHPTFTYDALTAQALGRAVRAAEPVPARDRAHDMQRNRGGHHTDDPRHHTPAP